MASTKRPIQPHVETDEWGLYDPATAGMPALFARLGKPLLRQSDASARRQKRRAARPERSNDGVCLAIEEVRRRAFPDTVVVAQPPAAPIPAARVVKKAIADTSKPARRRTETAAKTVARSTRHAMRSALVAAAAKVESKPTPRSKQVDPIAGRASVPPAKGARAAKAAGHAAAERIASAPAVPPPSPRRPRGPVPLAAWAHAVVDAPPIQERKRHDARGLWRSLFKIPSEVALIQYGRGCRIHRLVIEEPAETIDFY